MNAAGWIILLAASSAGLAGVGSAASAQMSVFSDPDRAREYSTRYHTIRTDLGGDDAREAVLRLSVLADEYIARTRGFSGRLDRRLPMYLFRHESDYIDAGGLADTAGFFDGNRLMIVAGKQAGPATWHTMQHEGFHQFASAVIHRDLPIWINEGLAEYFGEAIFTGDDYISGGIPQWRLERVREAIKEGEFVPLTALLTITPEQWNAQIELTRYDQAWAMVQFLAHADSGRYRRPFSAYIDDLSRSHNSLNAWRKHFGPDEEGLTRRFAEYWADLPKDPTATLYATAAARTLTLFLARAQANGFSPESIRELAAVVLDGRLILRGDDWLPPSLLILTLAQASPLATWSIDRSKGSPVVVGTLPSGEQVLGTFALRGTTIEGIGVSVDSSPVLLARAREAIRSGDLKSGLALYRKVLQSDSRSPATREARDELQALLKPPAQPSTQESGNN